MMKNNYLYNNINRIKRPYLYINEITKLNIVMPKLKISENELCLDLIKNLNINSDIYTKIKEEQNFIIINIDSNLYYSSINIISNNNTIIENILEEAYYYIDNATFINMIKNKQSCINKC